MPNIKCEDWEIADMEYALGLLFLMLNRNVSTIEYTKRAIIFFEKNFYYTRSIEAYVVLSIAYKNSQKYEEALNILKLAQKTSLIMNRTEQLSILHYNIGAILTKQGHLESAISNYQSCISLSSEDINTATSMLALTIEYAKQRDYASVIEWSQKGITLCENSSDPSIKIREPHFLCYQAIYGCIDNSEMILQKCIKFFEQQNDFRYSHKYSLQLAQYYVENKKYKKAALQYKKANDYLANKENRKYIEDL
jgi:tetratricopeptide (TPR) repeat protein